MKIPKNSKTFLDTFVELSKPRYLKYFIFKTFMLCVSAISVFQFINAAIQYWASDYMKIVMDLDDDSVFKAYVITCVTGPVAGIFVGGLVGQLFGGYHSRKSLFICCIFAFFAICCGIPITLVNKLAPFCACLWLFLFFSSCLYPIIVGTSLTELPPKYRAAGQSLIVFLYTALGFLPAPAVYGIIYDKTYIRSPRFALGFTVLYSIVGLIILIIAAFIRDKRFRESSDKVDNVRTETEMKNFDCECKNVEVVERNL
jgi:MFS family permease